MSSDPNCINILCEYLPLKSLRLKLILISESSINSSRMMRKTFTYASSVLIISSVTLFLSLACLVSMDGIADNGDRKFLPFLVPFPSSLSAFWNADTNFIRVRAENKFRCSIVRLMESSKEYDGAGVEVMFTNLI